MCGKFRDKLIDTRLAGHMPVHDATSVCPAHGLEACHGHKTSGVQPPCERDHIPIYEEDKEEIVPYDITSSNFSLWNRLKTEGTGFNVKLGLIARVTDYWRLGLAA